MIDNDNIHTTCVFVDGIINFFFVVKFRPILKIYASVWHFQRPNLDVFTCPDIHLKFLFNVPIFYFLYHINFWRKKCRKKNSYQQPLIRQFIIQFMIINHICRIWSIIQFFNKYVVCTSCTACFIFPYRFQCTFTMKYGWKQ